MDNSPHTVKAEERDKLINDVADDADGLANFIWPLRRPIALFLDLVSAGFRLVRPFTPQLIPLAVFLLTIPVIVFFSLSAGWFVWKSVAVGWETDVYLQYGDYYPPYAEVILPNLVTQQPYDIWLHIVVPTTEANLALGNFMTSMSIVTPANRTLAHVRKPALVLPPASSPISFLYNRPGTVDLNIPMLTSFSSDIPRTVARIELGRKDHWKSLGKGEGREISVHSAFLRGVVVHKGIRGLITRFPLVSALAAAGTFLFISFIILASCLLPAIEWRFYHQPHDEVYEKPAPIKSPRQRSDRISVDEKNARRAKASRRSRSSTSQTPLTKEEDISIPAPSGGVLARSQPLRRRRSRLSQPSDSDD